MKPLLFCILLCCNNWVWSQQTDTTATPTLTPEQYLQKSRTEKIAGNILLSAGLGGLLLTLGLESLDHTTSALGSVFSGQYEEPGSYTVYYGISAVAAVSGIVLLASAKKNKQRAQGIALHLGVQRAAVFGSDRNGVVPQPSVGFRVRIR